jgi:peptidoglycan/LPS O-acetylase OafA/YrhL
MDQPKLNALTGLRFLAASLILVHHSTVLRIPIPLWSFGHGVSLFFVLSGFILAYIYPRLDSGAKAKRFLILRVARIWPAHAATLLLTVVALSLPAVNWQFLTNLAMVQGWIPSEPWYFSFNAASWSISTEFGFYLAFPFLIWRWHTTWWWKWPATATLVVILVTVGKEASLPDYLEAPGITLHGLLYINPLARLFEFTTGMATYSCFARLQPYATRLDPVWASALELAILALTAWFIIDYPVFRYAVQYFHIVTWQEWLTHTGSLVIFPFLIIALGIGRGVVSRVLSSRLAVLLGELSYSVYLVHSTTYGFFARYWLLRGDGPDYGGWALCIAVTLVISFLIWKFIETPARRAAKRWTRRDRERDVKKSEAEVSLPVAAQAEG